MKSYKDYKNISKDNLMEWLRELHGRGREEDWFVIEACQSEEDVAYILQDLYQIKYHQFDEETNLQFQQFVTVAMRVLDRITPEKDKEEVMSIVAAILI